MPLTSLDTARGAFRLALDALEGEVELRRSLLCALSELPPSQEDERQRLLIVWIERPFSCAEDHTLLGSLRQRLPIALEALS